MGIFLFSTNFAPENEEKSKLDNINNRLEKVMINAQDIKKGTCIRMDGKLYFCIDFLHVKPGKGNTFMRTTLKDVVDGYVLERRFNIGEKLEDVRVERRSHQFLYQEGDDYIFMNNETFDQHPSQGAPHRRCLPQGEHGWRGCSRCFYRDRTLRRASHQGGAPDHLHRARPQG